jgi:hypothetical protein
LFKPLTPSGSHVAAKWQESGGNGSSVSGQPRKCLVTSERRGTSKVHTFISEDNSKMPSGSHVAAMWQPSCRQLATMWQPSGSQLAAMWQQSGSHVAAKWQESGGKWQPCGGQVAGKWLQCFISAGTTSKMLSHIGDEDNLENA